MSDIAIKVENLSKRYRIGLKDEMPDTLVGAVTQAIKRPLRNWRRLRRLTDFDDEAKGDDGRQTNDDDTLSIARPERGRRIHRPSSDVRTDVDRDTLWALKDVSFQVERGEVVGIIGRNGAGKSTLLKILSQITAPTEGRAVINGRVGSLLEVGTGFHQELTGRENIYLNGAILGMTKDEIDRKFDEIVDFSGVEKFIDTPVKHYSSGMRVRLAFSVAAHLDPEILLIDEVLAVGDAAFQKKCLGKMDDVAKSGRTVLFVSHDMGSIQNLCPRAILLEDGNLVSDSETDVVVNRYLQSVNSTFEKRKSISDVPRSSGHGVSLRFTECRILDSNGDETQKLQMGEPISILVKATAQERLNNVSFVIGIDNRKGSRITTAASEEVRKFYNFDEGEDIELIACFEDLLLNTGQYSITLSARNHRHGLDLVRPAVGFEITSARHPRAQHMVDLWGDVRCSPKWETVNCGGC